MYWLKIYFTNNKENKMEKRYVNVAFENFETLDIDPEYYDFPEAAETA